VVRTSQDETQQFQQESTQTLDPIAQNDAQASKENSLSSSGGS
jgi:hypothetical protein